MPAEHVLQRAQWRRVTDNALEPAKQNWPTGSATVQGSRQTTTGTHEGCGIPSALPRGYYAEVCTLHRQLLKLPIEATLGRYPLCVASWELGPKSGQQMGQFAGQVTPGTETRAPPSLPPNHGLDHC